MKQEIINLNPERDVTLTAYIQEVAGEFQFAKRPAILVLPGGGYAMCSDREADPVALAYTKAGYQAFILRYSTGKNKTWPNPLEDYEQAMALIEERAEEWHLGSSRIAAVGFSAGGHLCACAATIARHKPAAAILVYPSILKDICDMCQPGMPQPNEHVTGETSPCFLVAARDDRTVDVKNSLMMQLALAENGIPFESRIYSYGGHGFSTADDWIINNSLSPDSPLGGRQHRLAEGNPGHADHEGHQRAQHCGQQKWRHRPGAFGHVYPEPYPQAICGGRFRFEAPF